MEEVSPEEVVSKLIELFRRRKPVYGRNIHLAIAPDMELKRFMTIVKLFYDKKLILGHSGFPFTETDFENNLLIAVPNLYSFSKDPNSVSLLQLEAKEIQG